MARILIVDDDTAFRAAFAETLTYLGHEPIEAGGGREGLDAARHQSPDIVFLDYKMAGMDGIEVLREFAEPGSSPPVPVVMLTAFAGSASTIEAMKLGAYEHLTKPVARRDIEELLARLLTKPAAVGRRSESNSADRLVGNSPQMREVHKLIGRAASGVGVHPRHGRDRHGQRTGCALAARQLVACRQGVRCGQLRGNPARTLGE
jgi:DNA-binding NtrC family response regulator